MWNMVTEAETDMEPIGDEVFINAIVQLLLRITISRSSFW